MIAPRVALCCLLAAACAGPPPEVAETDQAAPFVLEYEPPEPGSYRLPPIQPAADGAVVDADGTERRLHDYLGDKHVLLSFVYTRCANPMGCPLASAVFRGIGREMKQDPELTANLRLVTLSFDPDRDTPEVLREYVGDRDYLETRWNARPWAMLTTLTGVELEPILEGYGQYVVREIDEAGEPTDRLAHVLKVFLIDRDRRVRNIYGSGFLKPPIAISDVRTLMMEEENQG